MPAPALPPTNPYQPPSTSPPQDASAGHGWAWSGILLSGLPGVLLMVAATSFADMYRSFGTPLPGPSRLLLAWPWVPLLAPLVLVAWRLLARAAGHAQAKRVFWLGLTFALLGTAGAVLALYYPIFLMASVV